MAVAARLRALFGKRELRASYTDLAIAGLVAHYSTAGVSSPGRIAIAAIGAAARFYASCVSQFTIEPDRRELAGIVPHLAAIGRNLALRGEWLGRIDVVDGRVVIIPSSHWTMMGGPNPANWIYEATEAGPSFTHTRRLTVDEVVHIRIGVDSSAPWRGRAPVEDLGETLRLAFGIETSASDEAALPIARLISKKSDDGTNSALSALAQTGPIDQGNLDKLAAQFNDLLGYQGKANRTAVLGLPTAATLDRIGLDYPNAVPPMRGCVELSCWRCFGIPAILFDSRAPGASYREAYRTLKRTTLAELATAIQAEIRDKLADTATVTTERLKASDITAEARAVGSLVTAGVDIAEARKIVGI